MSNYTSSLGLEQINPGDQAGLWGNTTNVNLSLIDQAIAGVTPVDFTGASGTTIALTDNNGAADQARAAVLNLTGTANGPNTIVVPNVTKTYLVRNGTGQSVTFQTASSSATYTVLSGNSILIFCDGNNNVYSGIVSPSSGTLTVAGGGTGSTTFTAGFITSNGGTTALSSQSTVNASSQISGTLPVSNGGTGASTLTSNSLLIGNGSGTIGTLLGGSSGQVATWNGSQWIASTPASAGVSSLNNGGNITLSGATGAVTISLTSGNVTGALGYTPVNPTTLSGYAQLSGATFTGSISAPAFSSGSQGSTFAGIGGGAASVQLYNGSTGIYHDGSKFGFEGNGSAVCFVYNGTGTIQNLSGLYQAVSDERIKENVTPARSYLADLQKLNVVNYNLKGRTDKYLGLIAQEVQAVIPGLVSEEEKNDVFPDVPNLLSVKYSILVPMLLQAVQELTAKITALEAKVGN